VLAQRVWADLRAGRSPRQIAGRLGAEAVDASLGMVKGAPHGQARRVSHESIYTKDVHAAQGLAGPSRVRLDSGRTARNPLRRERSAAFDRAAARRRRRPQGSPVTEGDLVIGRAGATAAASLVERTTRFTVILGLRLGKDSDALADALVDTVRPGRSRSSDP
jgi:IS30 family transposase